MSTFQVVVTRLSGVETHPNADSLSLAVVGDYRTVIKKGQYQAGDLVAYIPESAVLPLEVLRHLQMEGSSLLAGPDKNRVKAIKLRGELSQGLCYPVEPDWAEGQDVTDLLGITKYEPPIPAHLMGQVQNIGVEHTFHFDIENIKAWPDVLQEGEPVVFTEKIHGTWSCFGLQDGVQGLIVSSKGLFGQGLAFKDVPENALNLYVRVSRRLGIENRLRQLFGSNVYLIGEVFGVQDLKYGASAASDEKLGFRVFDIYLGKAGQGAYLGDEDLDKACERLSIPRVPVLYRGPFSKEELCRHTSGRETVSGSALHIREGVVVAPLVERSHPRLGRVKLKSVSSDYLLRKDKNATEFE
jgi:RNA ligase (TIGR02306 family)